jgi:hypothetical protein
VTPNHSWQELYAAAMLELDLACLPGRIEAAQAAIREAMKELAGTSERPTEMQEMSSAMGNLQALQRVELKDSKSSELGFSSDRGAAYATLVPQDNCTDLAQTPVRDDRTASLRENRDRSNKAGMPARQSCDA